ncbi:hypothetical protein [Streptomyces caelestis]|uniref:Uncharacterized protein n=1 Tax=Streptomyces caelestis TaxID=36816 RepID=A0A7W9H2C8_9ACTN|nr:hypothetical protein [Streptomyces caelestis]MBB5794433.1 hypothetical protein [Streptomyces caelestis]GGW30789.1 hypothetical protein GCM10010320_07460 [Streptomyces caelestis]
MPANRPATEEPRLTVTRPPRRRLRRALASALPVPVIGLVLLVTSGNLLLPLRQVVTIEAKMASKRDFFQDPVVERLLMKHGFRVHITNMGSREIAKQDYEGYDVVFPSGQPAADLISRERARANRPVLLYRPFVSPIVLATYRDYAEVLRVEGVATRLPGPGGRPMYYTLDMRKFLDLAHGKRTLGKNRVVQRDSKGGYRWDEIDRKDRVRNGNKILAQTSDICESNSAGTYLGLVAFVEHGNDAPDNGAEAEQLARKIKPLLVEQGLPSSERAETYLSPDGPSIAPISVIYEHQFLAHQIGHQAEKGTTDDERVLLYPSTRFVTEPQLVALTGDGARLGELISTDPELQHRAMELGFRARNATSGATSDELTRFLTERQIPVPTTSSDDTRAVLPSLPLLEKMIEVVGDCPDRTGSR